MMQIKKSSQIAIFVAIGLEFLSARAMAWPEYKGYWQNEYGASSTSLSVYGSTSPNVSVGCRLCHHSDNAAGDFGPNDVRWNRYGNAIQAAVGRTNNLVNENTFRNALRSVEGDTSVSTSGLFSYLAEISAGAQPGWRTGNTNELYNRDGNLTSSTTSPPGVIPLDPNPQPPSGAIASAVLPSSRSVRVGTPATAFATIINAGQSTATGCAISVITSIPATFGFQTTNPATNQVTGTPNTPVAIAAGAAQTFVFAITPTGPISSTDVQLSFDCANTNPAPINSGLNTLLFSASATPVPDIVALAATLTNDGIVNIPGTNGTGAFAVATVNVGASGSITATADTGGVSLPVSISICETNSATGLCVNPTAPTTSPVVSTINANATPTFAVFVQGNGNVPFDPAVNRIFVRFNDSGNVTRGSTSVAVRTQ